MAHLWMQDAEGAWGVLPLIAREIGLAALAARLAEAPASGTGRAAHATSAPAGRLMQIAGEPSEWALLAAPRAGVSVNGLPLQIGIHVLTDRDEIRIGDGGSVFFSTERLARAESLPVSERPLFCPRCRQPIEPGSPAVRCPQCALWHHQTDELPCWTYAPTCALCPQPTPLDTGFRWTPEDL